jgi:restriction system protein
MNGALRQELLTRIVAADATFFEHLVIDLMLAMGYGGSHADAARHLGMAGDGGIDGVIDGDPLGLDAVYLQAKKYAPGNSAVGRPELQAFVGSLVGRAAHKGVFITTSAFAQTARQYISPVPQKIVLIDGDQLTTFMIRYGVGVRTSRTVDLKRVDLDYFGPTEEQ